MFRFAQHDSEMRDGLFASLIIYRDTDSRSAAMNMAIDEVLLERAQAPSIRFYRWGSPALSFGYFGRFDDVVDYAGKRDLVRRWTGGGIVFHGDDLTYSIVIPTSEPLFGESSLFIYEKIHRALLEAFLGEGRCAELAPVAAVYDRRTNFSGARDANRPISNNATVTDRRYSECFANPVTADVMINGRKIAGAAQRRTGKGLLQQGSIQHVDVTNGLAERFAAALSPKCEARALGGDLVARAEEIAARKYADGAWLRKR
jgi:lipoate-protein ligase A